HFGDLARVQSRFLHVVEQLAGGRLHLTSRAGIEQHEIASCANHKWRERDRHEFIRQAGGPKSTLYLVLAGVLDERGVVWLLPDAVVDGRAVERADLVLVEGLGRGGRL